jgi:predicted short-subunit dehydrogenase-like oxidoreductase (DUF2520 family)
MQHLVQNISIVGSGNVATHLAIAFHNKGISVHQVIARNQTVGAQLAKSVGASYCNDPAGLEPVEVVFIAVADDAIVSVAEKLVGTDALVVHVSGAVSMEVLSQLTRYGVFYPLQTFSKDKAVDWNPIPVCIEASSHDDVLLLERLAGTISSDVRKVTSEQRSMIHLAAVFVSNFVNFLNLQAAEILEEFHLDRDILFPLIRETTNKLLQHSPRLVQTGPALRGDEKVIHKHLAMLEPFSDKQQVYQLLTTAIQQTLRKQNGKKF